MLEGVPQSGTQLQGVKVGKDRVGPRSGCNRRFDTIVALSKERQVL